jgi:hypothetical protein
VVRIQIPNLLGYARAHRWIARIWHDEPYLAQAFGATPLSHRFHSFRRFGHFEYPKGRGL